MIEKKKVRFIPKRNKKRTKKLRDIIRLKESKYAEMKGVLYIHDYSTLDDDWMYEVTAVTQKYVRNEFLCESDKALQNNHSLIVLDYIDIGFENILENNNRINRGKVLGEKYSHFKVTSVKKKENDVSEHNILFILHKEYIDIMRKLPRGDRIRFAKGYKEKNQIHADFYYIEGRKTLKTDLQRKILREFIDEKIEILERNNISHLTSLIITAKNYLNQLDYIIYNKHTERFTISLHLEEEFKLCNFSDKTFLEHIVARIQTVSELSYYKTYSKKEALQFLDKYDKEQFRQNEKVKVNGVGVSISLNPELSLLFRQIIKSTSINPESIYAYDKYDFGKVKYFKAKKQYQCWKHKGEEHHHFYPDKIRIQISRETITYLDIKYNNFDVDSASEFLTNLTNQKYFFNSFIKPLLDLVNKKALNKIHDYLVKQLSNKYGINTFEDVDISALLEDEKPVYDYFLDRNEKRAKDYIMRKIYYYLIHGYDVDKTIRFKKNTILNLYKNLD